MKNVEKELKYQLSKEDFIIFKKFLIENEYLKLNSFTQINYYIDTEELIFKERDITIRIRKILADINKYEFTIKIPINKNYGENYKIKNEYNIILDEEIAINLINRDNFKDYERLFTDILKEIEFKIDLNKLKVIGQLNTKRELYIIDKNYEAINIDISSYLDEEDYEIEWETEKIDGAERIITDIFKKISIVPNSNCISKNTRFFDKYTSL
ncbi:CYTH domain-containing protein [Abyssisolibacter fermentans]|uniref:CYTH domain-containing protein n=1 Tax=Abyssisolibacter fermentans TaxID=1766203 RepID=UPI000836F1B3|nr:CYTH domain-containing protein [Abyssisolibacter fermentans]